MTSTTAAESKARQRARNKEAADATGTRPSRSGSSGRSAELLEMERKTWDEVEPMAEHVADIAGVMYGGQLTAAGTMTLQFGCPLEYLHDAADVATAGREGALFFRVYVVTPESFRRYTDE